MYMSCGYMESCGFNGCSQWAIKLHSEYKKIFSAQNFELSFENGVLSWCLLEIYKFYFYGLDLDGSRLLIWEN